MKKSLTKWFLCCAAAVLCLAFAQGTPAASKAAANKKADKAYDKKVKSIEKKHEVLFSKYIDFTGDGIHEAFVEYKTETDGSGSSYVVYTWKNSKAKKVLESGGYGLSRIIYYKKAQSLILYGAGHGGEWYKYFIMKDGKYGAVAERARTAVAGGAEKNGAWNYSSGSEIKKKKFNTLIKPLKKGKKSTCQVTESVTKCTLVLSDRNDLSGAETRTPQNFDDGTYHYEALWTKGDGVVLTITNQSFAAPDSSLSVQALAEACIDKVYGPAGARDIQCSKDLELGAQFTYPTYLFSLKVGNNEDTNEVVGIVIETEGFDFMYTVEVDADSLEDYRQEILGMFRKLSLE